MGLSDWFRRGSAPSAGTQEATSSGTTARFAPVSEGDGMLFAWQVEHIKANLGSVPDKNILTIQWPKDPMLPECALLVPNLLAEFNQNTNLAMIHGLGTAHAFIDVKKLREVFAVGGDEIRDYRSLFLAFVARGYDVKKVKYIRFRSSLESDD